MILKEAQEKFKEKQAALAAIFEKAKTESGEYDFQKVEHAELDGLKTTVAKVEKIHQMEAELNALWDECSALQKAEKDWNDISSRRGLPAVGPAQPGDATQDRRIVQKSIGELIARSQEYADFVTKARAKGGINFSLKDLFPSDVLAKFNAFATVGTKTLFETTAGWAPESMRIPGLVVEKATRPVQLLDIIPLGRTSFEQIVYMEETTRTHSAAEKAEGVAYAESAFVLTEQTSNVRKITDSVPVTDEQLEDVEQAESYLNGRLVFGLRQRLDTQVLIGNGTAPNLRGIKNVSGILTQAKGTDPIPDAVHKLLRQIRVTGRAMPTHVIMHPTDWESVRLLRTADGIYIWGSPSEAGPERMWGLPVIQCDIDSAGTGYAGSFMPQWISLFERRGVDVQVGYVDTQFAQGKRTIRADMRMAFVVFRAAAFGTVTGL